MSEGDLRIDRAGKITAEVVCKAYNDAKPSWLVPSVKDCEAIASILDMYRGARLEREALLSRKPDASGRRRMTRHEAVRGAIGTLLRNLPDLAAWAPGHTAPAGSPHAESLVALLDATRLVAGLWPDLNGSVRRFDSRSRWARKADCIVGTVLQRWQAANPKRRIGKPLTKDQPMTRLMVTLLGLIERDAPTPEQVAQHFTRDKSGFVIMEAVKNSRQLFPT